jgi:hypothetical protein
MPERAPPPTLPDQPFTPRAWTVQGAVDHRRFGGAHYGTTRAAIVARRRAFAFALPKSPLCSPSTGRYDILRLLQCPLCLGVNLRMAIELGYARYRRYYWQTVVDSTA